MGLTNSVVWIGVPLGLMCAATIASAQTPIENVSPSTSDTPNTSPPRDIGNPQVRAGTPTTAVLRAHVAQAQVQGQGGIKNTQWVPAPSHGETKPPPETGASAPAASNGGGEQPAAPVVQEGNTDAGFDGKPLAGYHSGGMYIRDRADFFRLYPSYRIQLDSRHFAGPGVEHTGLKSTLMVRRAALYLRGEILNHWQWEMMGDFAPSGIDSTPAQQPKYQAKPVVVLINYRFSDLVNLQMGQFVLPFMAENLTSNNLTPFLERSFIASSFGIPNGIDIGLMAWGNLPKDKVFWSVALVQGDGSSRPNIDKSWTVVSRVFTRPLVSGESELRNMQLGISFRYGAHDKRYVLYDYPSMRTRNGFVFWKPKYQGGDASRPATHVIPSGDEIAVAGELRLPFNRFDITSEYVYVHNQTREAYEGAQATNSERFGVMKGHGYHITWSYWFAGKPFASGVPGNRRPKRVNLQKPEESSSDHSLELLVRWEQLFANYESAARAGTPDSKTRDGDIRVNVASLGLNYWAMKHLRLSVNYGLNMFPRASAATSTEQRAQAPGNQIAAGLDDDARNSAWLLHEFSTRVGVWF